MMASHCMARQKGTHTYYVDRREEQSLVRRFYEAQAKGDLDTLGEMLDPDIVDHNLRPGQGSGREGYLRTVAEVHAAYSDIQYDIDKQMAGEGDRW